MNHTPRPCPRECEDRAARVSGCSLRKEGCNRSERATASLPFRQLELNAAVAAEHFLAGARVERLKLAKASGDQALWRDPPADEVLHDCNRPGRRQLPI